MPKCKSCEHYRCKDWSVNYECKRGRSTPDYGDTDSCSEYEEQYNCIVAGTLGLERGWSYREEKQREGKDCDNYEDSETEDVSEKREEQATYSYSSDTYCGSCSVNPEVEKACAIICTIILSLFLLLFFVIILNIYSCQKKEEEEKRFRINEYNRLENLFNQSIIPTKQLGNFTVQSCYRGKVDISVADVGVKLTGILNDYTTPGTESICFGAMPEFYIEYDKRKNKYDLLLWHCIGGAQGAKHLCSDSKGQLDQISEQIYTARENWRTKYKELRKSSCDRWQYL